MGRESASAGTHGFADWREQRPTLAENEFRSPRGFTRRRGNAEDFEDQGFESISVLPRTVASISSVRSRQVSKRR
jgi:hypothetical protein